MNGARLDAEYHEAAEYAEATGHSHAERCGAWGADYELSCQRPPAHTGDHAAVLGMDPYVNDWVKWPA